MASKKIIHSVPPSQCEPNPRAASRRLQSLSCSALRTEEGLHSLQRSYLPVRPTLPQGRGLSVLTVVASCGVT
jgi:hypothetical protein